MFIVACILFACNGVLLYRVWSIEYATLPALRCCALCDRVTYHPSLWNWLPDCVHSDDSWNLEAQTCQSHHAIAISRFYSYPCAVDYGVYIRDTYGIACDIASYDSVEKQNMVSWYTLISQAMPSAACDTYIRMLKQYETNIRVEKCRVHER